jgi:hypothetical protein
LEQPASAVLVVGASALVLVVQGLALLGLELVGLSKGERSANGKDCPIQHEGK